MFLLCLSLFHCFCANLTSLDITPCYRHLSVCLSNAFIVTKRKHLAKKVQLWLTGSRLWASQWAKDEQRTFPLTCQFGYCGNSDSPDGTALRTCGICYENAHHNYVLDFTPVFRLSLCYTRDPRLNGLILKRLLHVRCALAVHGSGPTC